MRTILVIVQMLTFVGLAVVLASEAPKLAAAQALLAIITVLVYA